MVDVRRLGIAAGAVALALVAATGCATGPGAESDEPDDDGAVVLTLDAMNQYQRHVVACMADQGWDIHVTSDNGFGLATASGQGALAQVDLGGCLAEADDLYIPDWTEDTARTYYAEMVELGRCLAEHGYPTSDPVSEQSFVDALFATDDVLWHPFTEALQAEQDAGGDVDSLWDLVVPEGAECPQPLRPAPL
ncbi:hypothetical protein [Cellulomonas triticagri]|uniref:DUF732 domain-containing protein n=1 Tax=Cellulomonas triticagri TaxID=2483352 RepID=A0A3M2JPE0_9CELL|nr:hypothetical protein [Cellulomonas triticagri]RMI13523.1 hypothetical protein EBM89_04230 [Cellulomonas triticagri]